MTLILGSKSAARRAMLDAAGLTFDVKAALVDEDAAKDAFRAEGMGARDLADALAELKAIQLSRRYPGDLVLGCDQTLALADGTMLDKPESKTVLGEQLRQLAGQTHELYSAAVIAEAGQPVWRHVERVRLTMRPMSDAFIATYIDQDWDEVQYCVGGYRIEGPGVQLFSKIEGSHFAILGLPLLPILAWLRERGYLVS